MTTSIQSVKNILSIKSDVLHYYCTYMKRPLQYTSQKITTHLQRSLARHLGSCSYVKRLLQYSQSKKQNNHAIFRSPTSLSRSPPIFLSSLLFSLHTCLLHLLCTRLRLLVSRLCFSSLLLASRHECFSHALYLDMHVMSYMRCLASRFHYVHASLLYLYTSSRASWLYALTSYHTLHHCSVLVQRTSRQSELCRGLATSAQHPLPVISTLHMLYKLSYRIRE